MSSVENDHLNDVLTSLADAAIDTVNNMYPDNKTFTYKRYKMFHYLFGKSVAEALLKRSPL